MTQDWLYRIFTPRHRWLAAVAALVLCAGLALVAGYLLSEFGPLIAAAGVAAMFLGLWMLRDIEVAYGVVFGVVCLLPSAAFPFDLGFTPTFLDAAVGALFFVWAFQVATGLQREFITTSLGGALIVFMMLAVGAFVLGLSHSPFTAYSVRHFAELLLSISLVFLVANTVRDVGRLRRIVRAFFLAAFAAAVVGIMLYVTAAYVSDELVVRTLSALGRFGYPTGPGVLRYIRDNPELPMRATSTSIDPNVLGNLLNLALAVGVGQLFAQRPFFRHRYLVPMVGVIALCLMLTISRGALAGVGVALTVMALLRYRKLLWLLLAAALAVLILAPGTVDHFLQGLRGEDLATQMRFGEYKDALILIGRYPFLGVGFAGSPDIDTYVGVSNVYLLIAEQMGLIGLTSFLVVIGLFFLRFWRARVAWMRAGRRQDAACAELEPLWWGLHAAIVGGLVGGVVDHYSFNLDFHYSVTLFWLVVGLATAATEIVQQQCVSVSQDPRPPAQGATG